MLAVTALSHCPLMGKFDPSAEIVAEVDGKIGEARRFAEAFDPDFVVLIAPDHYNGFFYRMMPQFCVGSQAVTVGDYGTEKGGLSVPPELAREIAAGLLAEDVDIAVSELMTVDHGFSQPLEMILGGLDTRPVVPIFINAAAPPLTSWGRVRQFGTALGKILSADGRRILIIASGGLSHDPPLPSIHAEDPVIVERAVSGAGNEEARPAREANAVKAAERFLTGDSPLVALNPTWDQEVLRAIAEGDLSSLDDTDNAWVTENCGKGAHEARTWVAAFGALGDGYTVDWTYYRAIQEWLTGFGMAVGAAK